MHFIIITAISYSMNRMVVLMKQSFIGKMDGGNSDGKGEIPDGSGCV